MPRLLPAAHAKNLEEQQNEKNFHNQNPDVIAAWDLEKGGWRSFRIESVTYCQVLDNY
jgi:predicted DNA-binding transcriptional regulator YafY